MARVRRARNGTLGLLAAVPGAGMIYIDGKQAHKLENTGMIDHLVELVEQRAQEIEAKTASIAPAAE